MKVKSRSVEQKDKIEYLDILYTAVESLSSREEIKDFFTRCSDGKRTDYDRSAHNDCSPIVGRSVVRSNYERNESWTRYHYASTSMARGRKIRATKKLLLV